jgi:hypothetical protein
MTTDADLIHASRSDAEAFRQMYDRYAERVYRMALLPGRAAVDQQIIGPDFLGDEYAPSPGVG